MEKNINSFIDECIEKDYNVTKEELKTKLQILAYEKRNNKNANKEDTIFYLLNNLKELSNQLIYEKKIIPGIQGYLNVNDISIHFNYGQQSFNDQQDLRHNSIFDLASLTKLFTMITTLRLIEKGKFKLSDNIKDISKKFNLNITVKDLLTFHKEIKSDGRLDEINNRSLNLEKLYRSKIENNDYAYSDIPYIILGELIHEKTGIEIDNMIEETILKPLKMKETGYGVNGEKKGRIAGSKKLYNVVNGKINAFDPKSKTMGPIGSAGIFSTTDDLKKLGNYLISLDDSPFKDLLNQAATPIDINNRGMAVYTRNNEAVMTRVFSPARTGAAAIVGHAGSYMCFDPKRQFHSAILTNGYDDQGNRKNNFSTELDYFRKAVYNLSIQVECLDYLYDNRLSKYEYKIKVK